MFKNIFKRCWIAEEVVRYLESLPRFFRVSYTVDVGGRSVKFPIRDEDGNLYDAWDSSSEPILFVWYRKDD